MLRSNVTTLAWCFEFSFITGEKLGFTNHHQDIIIDNITYNKLVALSNSALQQQSKLKEDNMEIIGILNHELLSADDLKSGKFDGAKIKALLVNYNNPTNDYEVIFHGKCGEIKINDGNFVLEILGIQKQLENTIGELYSPNCRAKFCDANCALNQQDYTQKAIVTEVIDNKTFIATQLEQPKSYYDYGVIKFISGKNHGKELEIRHFYHFTVELVMPLHYPITQGDKFLITAGCDKTFATCCNKFNNAINFRGEPHIPGKSKLLTS